MLCGKKMLARPIMTEHAAIYFPMFFRSLDQTDLRSEIRSRSDQDRTAFEQPEERSGARTIWPPRTIHDAETDPQTKDQIRKIKICVKTDPDQRSDQDQTGFDPRSDGSEEHRIFQIL